MRGGLTKREFRPGTRRGAGHDGSRLSLRVGVSTGSGVRPALTVLTAPQVQTRLTAFLPGGVMLRWCIVVAVVASTAGCAVVADSGLIVTPLAPGSGDAGRGRALIVSREANCILCHAIPETGERFMGDLAPPLSGVGTRLTSAELRTRIVNPMRYNPDTIMPAYHRTEGLVRVAAAYRGKPVLDGQQVEDVVAYLTTLK